MIIAIDGYEANVENRVGIGRFACEILTHIFQAAEKKGNVSFRIYLPDSPRSDMPKETRWWRYRVVSPQKLWTFLALPFYLFTDTPRADVIFSPTHYIPRFIPIPRVFSIMDLSYIHYPEMFRAKDLHQLVHGTRYSARLAGHILTISEFSKRAIMEEYHVPEERITVIYPGLTIMKQGVGKIELKHPYILSVGTLQPRKNFVRLIEAFSKLEDKKIYLVIVGKKGWLFDEIVNAPKKYDVESRVKFLDFVPDEDLPSLYKNALCFALPSLYEGFGLPVLEAMSYGCPVVVSKTSSLPEIAGEAGMYVNPEEVRSINIGLAMGIRARESSEGKQKIKAGLSRAKQFTWENAAKKTLEILQNI